MSKFLLKLSILLICIALLAQKVQAQISAEGIFSMGAPKLRSDLIDTIVVYNDDSKISLSWNPGTLGDFKWSHYVNDDYIGSSFTITDTLLSINSTSSTLKDVKEGGYIITHTTPIDTTQKVIWVLIYNKHTPLSIDTVIIDDSGLDSLFDPCKTLYLSMETQKDSFFYYAPPDPQSAPLRLENVVSYTTGLYVGTDVISIDAPYQDGTLSVEANEKFVFEEGLSIPFGLIESTSANYNAIAINSEIEPVFSGTDNTPDNVVGNLVQEGKRYSVSIPKNLTLSTSTANPLDIYDWKIFQLTDTAKILITTYDESDFSFPLTYSDTFLITVNVSNGRCNCNDSIRVIASEVLLEAPNTFTPNGDGINDEFKVSYRSLTSFEGYIYNRWGKRIFSWTDPSKGWNGRSGGVESPPGAYFYKITATGSKRGRNVTQSISGDINLIRPK